MNMNSIENEQRPWIEAAHGMRMQLFDNLSDADLRSALGELYRYKAQCLPGGIEELRADVAARILSDCRTSRWRLNSRRRRELRLSD